MIDPCWRFAFRSYPPSSAIATVVVYAAYVPHAQLASLNATLPALLNSRMRGRLLMR